MRCDEVGIADGSEGSMPAIIANYGEKVVPANVKNFLNKEILTQYGWQESVVSLCQRYGLTGVF